MNASSYQVTYGVILLTVTTIVYGGSFVLKVTRGTALTNELQTRFFRAGHGHAGVLVILSLITLALLQMASASTVWVALAFGIPVAAVLIPLGFFVSVGGIEPTQPNSAIALLWVGVVILVIGLLGAGIGLIVTGLS